MGVLLRGFKRFVEDDTHSLSPKDKGHRQEPKDDYLDALDDELGYNWKKDILSDRVVINQPIEIGNYYYKTSAWKVVDADDNFVRIRLDAAGTPNIANNVFRKDGHGHYRRITKEGPFDTSIYVIPRKSFAQILDAAFRLQAQPQAQPPGGMPGAPLA